MNSSKCKTLFLLMMLISIAQSGLSLYLPSLPAITLDLATTASKAQLTVVNYVVGIGFSQLIYGPLSDIYGRKSTVLCGLGLFLIGSLLAVCSTTMDMLLIARLLQGLGIGSATTMSRAILRDVFRGKDYVKAGSQLAGAVAIVPILAPIAGGYLQAAYGWHTIFYVLLTLSIILFICWQSLFKETLISSSKRKLSILTILQDYASLLKSTIFLRNVIGGGLIYSGEVVFLSMTPFLIQSRLHQSSTIYGLILFFIICGYMLGTHFSSRFSSRLSCPTLIMFGMICALSSSIIMIILSWLHIFNIASITLPLMLFMFGTGFVYPNTSVSAVAKFSTKAGSASALFSSGQGLIASSAGILVSATHSTTFIGMASILLILCLSALIFTITFHMTNKQDALITNETTEC